MIAEHFRTVEQLQHIRDSGLMQRSKTLDERYFSAPVHRSVDGQEESKHRKQYRRPKGVKAIGTPETARTANDATHESWKTSPEKLNIDIMSFKQTNGPNSPTTSAVEDDTKDEKSWECTEEEVSYALDMGTKCCL